MTQPLNRMRQSEKNRTAKYMYFWGSESKVRYCFCKLQYRFTVHVIIGKKFHVHVPMDMHEPLLE